MWYKPNSVLAALVGQCPESFPTSQRSEAIMGNKEWRKVVPCNQVLCFSPISASPHLHLLDADTFHNAFFKNLKEEYRQISKTLLMGILPCFFMESLLTQCALLEKLHFPHSLVMWKWNTTGLASWISQEHSQLICILSSLSPLFFLPSVQEIAQVAPWSKYPLKIHYNNNNKRSTKHNTRGNNQNLIKE